MPKLLPQPSDVLLKFPISNTKDTGTIFAATVTARALRIYVRALRKRILALRSGHRKVKIVLDSFDACLLRETIKLERLRQSHEFEPLGKDINFTELDSSTKI